LGAKVKKTLHPSVRTVSGKRPPKRRRRPRGDAPKWLAVSTVALVGFAGLVLAQAEGLAVQQVFDYILLVLVIMVHFGKGQ
jgi:hypothetical protein